MTQVALKEETKATSVLERHKITSVYVAIVSDTVQTRI